MSCLAFHNVLLKFRNHTVGMSSDIGKMFREVALDPLDRDLHRYIVQDDQLCTVKAWVHLNWSEGHISGYGGYLEQAMNF